MPMREDRRGWGAATGGVSSIPKGPNNYFRLGDWKFQCDECGLWYHASVALKRWDGCMVDPKCFELRNPGEFVRGIPDNQTPPWTRPRGTPMPAAGNASVRPRVFVLGGKLLGGQMLG